VTAFNDTNSDAARTSPINLTNAGLPAAPPPAIPVVTTIAEIVAVPVVPENDTATPVSASRLTNVKSFAALNGSFARPFMQLTAHLRLFSGIAVSTALLSQQALALVSLNDGTDKIYVTGNVAVTRDSNIFANSSGGGDYIYSGGLDLEYQRKAGWIAVDGTIGVDISKFGKFSEENFQNPSFGLEFTSKQVAPQAP